MKKNNKKSKKKPSKNEGELTHEAWVKLNMDILGEDNSLNPLKNYKWNETDSEEEEFDLNIQDDGDDTQELNFEH